MSERFYITTPIYYSNDVPHIGHTGTTVFADIIARYQRSQGKEVFFLTGTDEHGEKVAKAAEMASKKPQEFVDELALKWQEYWKKLNISNDQFMRTTLPGHEKIVKELLIKLQEKGDIYKGVYKGIYCWGCEEFKSEKDLVDGKCPEHRPDQIEYKEEENYFFRLSKYIPKVKELIDSKELLVEPENKKNEMLSRINEGVNDLSASRQNVAWGIPIPWDTSHTTYVWIEALMNYYSATKFWNKEEFWPADVHFLGKGNNWFHSVIWPALLLALDLPLPKRIFVHGYYNVEGRKMGKSLGNVISPQDLIDRYGVDGTRYLLAASMPYSDDSDVSMKWFDEKYNSNLANGLGNLVSRVAKFINEGSPLKERVALINMSYEDFKLNEVVTSVQELIRSANDYFSTEAPWKLEGEAQKLVIDTAIEKILEVVGLIAPIMPETSSKIEKIITGEIHSENLFMRIV
ncbi:methionine--tRNA ligase [candidate division WWE3 bacterium CG_4_9_14_0_2_um_filter_35_11]|uniref:Methionine--tRNA ligase n=1 Tax=candidate division WWE3 bacterium CG_4_9_14_0_2_um_filter_35_11 TaxID=1975077 RepID=A0A2M8ELJ9_UNCKA|nr:MAG: methionine--tRNA ligase [candidate division WWE3 bacterium CG10_big_fil_rev_8_21_14_0_10_35_32]PJC23619.1 MAG: methionine--tRNA ligase [candidate division WWE3 bacterium CG_4_9_14_0_2_um_filter_35_11]